MKIFNAAANTIKEVAPIVKTDAEWRKLLTPEQFSITRQAGTEMAFSNTCAVPPGRDGIYQCICCGTDIFNFASKFESGTGWPSFLQPVSDLNVRLRKDTTGGMERTEVLCARCGAHLGHVFNDVPQPGGRRYCINAVALQLSKDV